MTTWSKLLKAWEEYFRFYVVDNDDMLIPCLHNFLGCFLKTKYVYAGHYSSVRFHLFMIRPSRTGKGQAMKCIYYLNKKVGISSFMTVKVTDASLIGTLEKNSKGKVDKTLGLLSDHSLIAWDEGNIILTKSPFSENVADIIQMASDEPGYISKALRHGTMGYKTDTTFLTGSIPTMDINKAVLTRGTLQRFFVNFKKYTQQEVQSINNKVITLLDKDKSDRDKAIAKLMKILDKIRQARYLKINYDDALTINNKINTYFEKDIMRQYSDDKQDVLFSFFHSARNYLFKTATQHSIINEENEVGIKDLEYGFTIFKSYIDNVKTMLDAISGTQRKVATSRESLILIIVRKEGVIDRQRLLKKLSELKDLGRWDFGLNRTEAMIKDLVSQGKLLSEMVGISGRGSKRVFRLPR